MTSRHTEILTWKKLYRETDMSDADNSLYFEKGKLQPNAVSFLERLIDGHLIQNTLI